MVSHHIIPQGHQDWWNRHRHCQWTKSTSHLSVRSAYLVTHYTRLSSTPARPSPHLYSSIFCTPFPEALTVSSSPWTTSFSDVQIHQDVQKICLGDSFPSSQVLQGGKQTKKEWVGLTWLCNQPWDLGAEMTRYLGRLNPWVIPNSRERGSALDLKINKTQGKGLREKKDSLFFIFFLHWI